MFYKKTWFKNFWIELTRAIRPNATFGLREKSDTGCRLSFYKKNPNIFLEFSRALWKNMDFIPVKSYKNQSILCNNSGVITCRIELTDLNTARKSKKRSSFSVKWCNVFFSFLIFSQLLPVLAPASFSPLLSFVRNLPELLGHVYLIPNIKLYHREM